jgi:hypothetical protein
MKNEDNMWILDQEPNSEDFTQHGLHLNVTGKDKIMKLMSQNISQLFEVEKKHPIILKWRTTHSVLNAIKSNRIANWAENV